MLRHEQEPESHSKVRFELQPQVPNQTETIQREGKKSDRKQWAIQNGDGALHPLFALVGAGVPFLGLWLSLQSSLPLWVLPAVLGGLVGVPAILLALFLKSQSSLPSEPTLPEGGVMESRPILDTDGVSEIGPILDALAANSPNRYALTQRLLELLPRLQPEDAALLESRHYGMLNAYLHKLAYSTNTVHKKEKTFLMAVLDAYANIGDERALPDVQRLAQGKGDAEIRAAAQRCLPHLEQAAEALRQQETLLRGSEAPLAQEALLRPAAFAADSACDQLLRPTDTDKDAL